MTSKSTRNVFRASIWNSISHLYNNKSEETRKGKVEIFNTLIKMYFKAGLEKPILNEKVSYEKVCELFGPTRRMTKCEAKRYWESKENLFEFTPLTGRLVLARKDEWELQKYLSRNLTNIFDLCVRRGYNIDKLEKKLTNFFKLVNGRGIRKALLTGQLSTKFVNNCGVFVLKEGQLPEKFSFQEVYGIRDSEALTFDLYRRKFLTKFFPDFIRVM